MTMLSRNLCYSEGSYNEVDLYWLNPGSRPEMTEKLLTRT